MLKTITLRPSYTFGPMLVICMTIILLSRTSTVLSSVLSKDANDLRINRESNRVRGDPMNDFEKRKTWQNLHGGWGKRAATKWNELPVLHASEEEISGENQPEAWLHLTMPVTSDERKNRDKISLIYLSNDKLPNDDEITPTLLKDNHDKEIMEDVNEDEDQLVAEKRSWKNINVAWGKRRQPAWNKFRGAWGKREPSWNNLKGMWGKRDSKHWQKLHNSWGKRDPQMPTLDEN